MSSILEKVRRLRALSKSSNANEAAAAAAAAERLIQEHQIAEAEIAASTGELDECPEVGQVAAYGRSIPMWKSELTKRVAKIHGCITWIEGVSGGPYEYKIAGRASDVGIVTYLVAWLTLEIERLTQANGRGMGRTWMNSYRLGCMVGVCDAMRVAEVAARTTASSAALVVVDARLTAATELRAKLCPDLFTKKTSAVRLASDAFADGRRAGERIQQRAALPTAAGPRALRGGT